MLTIFAVVFSISSIIISYKLKEDYDPHLLIKLVGLFILSVVTISFNVSIPIPAGFVIAFLLSKLSRNNKKPKQTCTLLGIMTTILCTLHNLIK